MIDLHARVAATEGVIARFDKPFDWAGPNCIRLARAQATALGHDLPPVPMFRTPLGARRALKKRGFVSVSALLDRYFIRLDAPARAIVGDLVVGPAGEQHGLEAVGIADGTGKVVGWHEASDYSCLDTILQANAQLTGAWRL